jgi:hypothetical protein
MAVVMNKLTLKERIANNIVFATLQHPVTNITLLLINTILVFMSVFIAHGALSETQTSVENTTNRFRANRVASDSLFRTQVKYSKLLNDTLVSQVVKLQQISQTQLKNSLLLSDNLISQVGKLQQVNQSQLNYSQLLSDSLIHQISHIQQINRNQLEMSNKQLIILDKFQKEQVSVKQK